MNILIISNLILFIVLLGIYLYIKYYISKSLFYNAVIFDILIYFIFPIIVFFINIVLCSILNLDILFLAATFVPLTVPIFKLGYKYFVSMGDHKLYNTYSDRIRSELIELLPLTEILVDKSNITLYLKKINNVISCDVYIKTSDIQEKEKKKEKIKSMLTDIFINVKFNVIFDIKFKYKKKVLCFSV